MSISPFAWSAAIAFVATGVLCVLAERLGLGDAAVGPDAKRKLQRRAVPPVGGLAIVIAWLLCASFKLTPDLGITTGGLPDWFASPTSIVAALAVAFVVGAIDDLRAGGLSPFAKLGGQLLAGFVLAAPCWTELPLVHAAGWSLLGALGAAAACNIWNTFDNADGAAAGLSGTGLAILGHPAAWAILGFLPWNLILRKRGDARAYLGDSGSHLLGMLVLVQPAAWPLALLPAVDLARVAFLRLRAGDKAWRGDRRHLAHVLMRRGWPPVLVAAALIALGVLPILMRLFG